MGKRLIIPSADFSANAIEQEPIIVPVDFTLVNGFASKSGEASLIVDDHAQSNQIRVRTGQIEGSCKIKTNVGYTIRAIVTYQSPIDLDPVSSPYTNIGVITTVPNVQGMSEFTLDNSGQYSIITFCKSNANQNISASEDIVDYIIRP